jgi:hypothetical protein
MIVQGAKSKNKSKKIEINQVIWTGHAFKPRKRSKGGREQ